MRIFFILFSFFIFVFIPVFSFAETNTNTGLVEHTIWYSKDPFFEGDTVKIYTLLYNSEKSAVSGTVEFYDGKVLLGSKNILISPESAKDVFVSWVVTSGEHSISAKFLNPTITVNGKQETIVVDNGVSSERKIYVPKKVISESKEVDGDTNTSSADTIVDKFAEKVAPYTPEPVDQTAIVIDEFRSQTSEKIAVSKENTKDRIEQLKGDSIVKASPDNKSISKESLNKPLAYISLFFWTLLSFIFSHKVVFYGLILLIVILGIRFIWRRFHN